MLTLKGLNLVHRDASPCTRRLVSRRDERDSPAVTSALHQIRIASTFNFIVTKTVPFR